MTSKQRVLAAVNHSKADRTPITFDAQKEVYDLLYQRLGLHTRRELFDRLNVDTWMILPKGFEYSEAEKKKVEKTAVWGYKRKTTEYSGGTYEELIHSPLAGKDEISDIRNHPWPGSDTWDYSGFPAESKANADRAIIGTFTWGAYFIASFVRGMEDLMIDFGMRKDYADHLIKTISEISYDTLNTMLTKYGAGVDIVYMADDYCSQLGPLFSPETFKEFCSPYLRKYVDLVHKHHKKFLLHVCGSVRPLLPLIIDAGVDMLEPIQIRAAGMDPAGLKKDFGKHICFYGGVDLQETLSKGSPDAVAAEVRRLIDVLDRDGGYVLGPGHTYIQIDASFENIMAMYETGRTYGAQRKG